MHMAFKNSEAPARLAACAETNVDAALVSSYISYSQVVVQSWTLVDQTATTTQLYRSTTKIREKLEVDVHLSTTRNPSNTLRLYLTRRLSSRLAV